MGRAFLELARQLATDPDGLTADIGRRIGPMISLIDSAVYNGDRQARDIFEALLADCDALGRRHDVTRPLLTAP